MQLVQMTRIWVPQTSPQGLAEKESPFQQLCHTFFRLNPYFLLPMKTAKRLETTAEPQAHNSSACSAWISFLKGLSWEASPWAYLPKKSPLNNRPNCSLFHVALLFRGAFLGNYPLGLAAQESPFKQLSHEEQAASTDQLFLI